MQVELLAKVILIIMLVVMFIFTVRTEKVRKCWKRKYRVEVNMPGLKSDPNCRKTIILHKCEGWCSSESGPVVTEKGVRWDYKCKCCQPKKYKEKVVHFGKDCPGSLTIWDIRNCHCKECWPGVIIFEEKKKKRYKTLYCRKNDVNVVLPDAI